MNDSVSRILALALEPSEETSLRAEIADHVAAVRASAGGGNRDLVRRAEKAVRKKPARAFAFDHSGYATLTAAGHSWRAGRFEAVSIGELKARVNDAQMGPRAGEARLWVFDGASSVMDIGALQATNGIDTLFQVASQFNCLESPGAYVTPVANYFSDSTQGPRASISAFPATLLRHYAAAGPSGERFVQGTDGRQIDLLADACGPGVSHNGYLTGHRVADPSALADALESRFESIRVGVHDGAQVVLGYDWDGSVEDSPNRLITQVFTSTAAGGFYGDEKVLSPKIFPRVCRQLLRAAYLGTLLAALSLGQRNVLFTLIGGGVFRNPVELIWDAIRWATDEVTRCLSTDLDVIVNGRNLGSRVDLDATILPAVRERRGAILTFDDSDLVAIRR